MSKPFAEHGFMADEMALWLDKTSTGGRQHVELALRISTEILNTIYQVQIPRADCHRRVYQRGPVLAGLFMRGFSLYQATYILARRGMAVDAGLTCRGLLDVAFK